MDATLTTEAYDGLGRVQDLLLMAVGWVWDLLLMAVGWVWEAAATCMGRNGGLGKLGFVEEGFQGWRMQLPLH